MAIQKSESITKLSAALAKAQSQIKGATKDSVNPHFKSRFADLESCWEALREPLSKNGLAVIQLADYDKDAGPMLNTVLTHESGEWISGCAALSPKSATPQDIGSATTYARRYWLCAITGLYQTDDDAEGAMGRPSPATQSQSRPAVATQNRTAALAAQAQPRNDAPPPGMFDDSPLNMRTTPSIGGQRRT